MTYDLPDESRLPNGFDYPQEFLKVVRLNLVNLDPWILMDEDQIISRLEGLKKRYPKRILIPFARRIDNDDVACFELGKDDEVQVIHDFASQGFEQRKAFESFWEWFKEAIDEMIEFD